MIFKKQYSLDYFIIVIVLLIDNLSYSHQHQHENSRFRRGTSIQCLETEILIEGDFISLESIRNFEKSCPPETIGNIKTLKIFSYNTLIIDADLDFDQIELWNLKSIIFISPEWRIIGSRKINLGGFNESAYLNEISRILQIDNKNGSFGSFPKPDDFFGIGYNITNRSNLIIAAKENEDLLTNNFLIELKDVTADQSKIEHWFTEARYVSGYLREFRKSLIRNTDYFYVFDFIKYLNKLQVVEFLSDPIDLATELDKLEDDSISSKNDLSIFYEHFLNVTYILSKRFERDSQEFNFLKYLFTATLSKKNSIKDSLETSFITNIPKYLENLKSKYSDLEKDYEKNNKINLYSLIRKNMKDNIETFDKKIVEEIKSAEYAINYTVNHELPKIKTSFNHSMTLLIQEIKGVEANYSKYLTEREKTKSKLFNTAVDKSVLVILDVVAVGLLMTGPLGMTAGSVIIASTQIGQSIIDKDYKSTINKMSYEATNVRYNAMAFQAQIEARKSDQVQKLENMYNSVQNNLEKKINRNIFSEQQRKDIEDVIIHPEKYQFEDVVNMQNTIKKKISKYDYDSLEGESRQSAMTTANNIALLAAAPAAAASIGLTIYDYKSQIEESDKLKEEEQKQLAKFEDFERRVGTEMLPMLKSLADGIILAKNNIGNHSKVRYDLLRYRLENTFNELKTYFNRTIDNQYHMKSDLFEAIRKIERLLPIFFDTNNVIKNLEERRDLAHLIKNLTSAQFTTSDKYKKVISNLEVKIKANILFKDYIFAYQALKIWTFPFTEEIVKNFVVPKEYKQYKDFELVEFVRKQLEEITLKINDSKDNLINSRQQKILAFAEFGPDHAEKSFFVWENKDYRDHFIKLLAGENIILDADINKSNLGLEVVRIRVPKFYFLVEDKNEDDQRELEKLMSHTKIVFHHHAKSFYKYKNKNFLFTIGDVTSFYSYRDGSIAGQPDDVGDSYVLMSQGDIILSPYATWSIRLETYPPNDKELYRKLARFAGKIHLELGGKGSYVSELVMPP